MASLSTVTRYLSQRLDYSINLCWAAYKMGHVTERQVGPLMMKSLVKGNLTYLLHCKKGEEMAPTISGSSTTLLVRNLIMPDAKRVFVGDVVVIVNPLTQNSYLVRRIAATEGCEMLSTDKTDEPFVLEKNHCWVLADNETVNPKEANDSRTFGPIEMETITGRVLYSLTSAADRGIVQNSESGMQMDSPVLEVELNVDELVESHEAESAKMKNQDS